MSNERPWTIRYNGKLFSVIIMQQIKVAHALDQLRQSVNRAEINRNGLLAEVAIYFGEFKSWLLFPCQQWSNFITWKWLKGQNDGNDRTIRQSTISITQTHSNSTTRSSITAVHSRFNHPSRFNRIKNTRGIFSCWHMLMCTLLLRPEYSVRIFVIVLHLLK